MYGIGDSAIDSIIYSVLQVVKDFLHCQMHDCASSRFQLQEQNTRWQRFPSNSCFLSINLAQSSVVQLTKPKDCVLLTMADSRGPILIVNVLIFGIIAFCFVTSRLGFRLYTKKTSASDWCLAAALASLAPLSEFLRTSAGSS